MGGGLESARRLRPPVAGACLAGLAGACHAAPRGRPVKMGPVDTGPQSVEATRRQLEGAWELVKLETYPAPGKVVPIEATGRMTFDAYGNVRTQGVVQGGGADAQRFLAYEGQVVIDPQKKEGRLVEVTPEGKRDVAKLPTEVGIDKIRMYEFVNDQLKLSLRDAAGKVTATATWRRAP